MITVKTDVLLELCLGGRRRGSGGRRKRADFLPRSYDGTMMVMDMAMTAKMREEVKKEK